MLVITVFICLYAMQAFYFSNQNAENAAINSYKHSYIQFQQAFPNIPVFLYFYFYATSARGLR